MSYKPHAEEEMHKIQSLKLCST